MSPVAIDVNTIEPYVLKGEERLPWTKQTTFYLGNLKHRDLQKVKDLITDGFRQKAHLHALSRALKGWTNFKDRKGDIVTFSVAAFPDQCAPENLDRLSPEQKNELAERILAMNQLTEGEQKN